MLIVQATIQFALAILAEAGLSYLGLGTQPPQPSWGRMLSEAQTLMFQAPRLAVFPGVATLPCIAFEDVGFQLFHPEDSLMFGPVVLARGLHFVWP